MRILMNKQNALSIFFVKKLKKTFVIYLHFQFDCVIMVIGRKLSKKLEIFHFCEQFMPNILEDTSWIKFNYCKREKPVLRRREKRSAAV